MKTIELQQLSIIARKYTFGVALIRFVKLKLIKNIEIVKYMNFFQPWTDIYLGIDYNPHFVFGKGKFTKKKIIHVYVDSLRYPLCYFFPIFDMLPLVSRFASCHFRLFRRLKINFSQF